MDYEERFKSLLKKAGFKLDGPYVEIDGHLCSVHVRPLKKRVEVSKVMQETKEDTKERRMRAMLQSVKETHKTDRKPSDAYGEKGFEKTSAAGVLTNLKNQGFIDKDEKDRYFLTKTGEEKLMSDT